MTRRAAGVVFLPILVFALFLAAVWIFESRVENFDTQVAIAKRQVIDQRIGIKPKILIAGDSTALTGLHALMFGDSTYSLALANGSSIETYYALRDFLAKRPAPDCILLALSQQWPDYKVFFWRTFVRSGFFNEADLEDIYRTSRELSAFPGHNYSQLEYKLWTRMHRTRILGLGLPDLQDSILNPPEFAVALRTKKVAHNHGSWVLTRQITPKPVRIQAPPGDTKALFEFYQQKIFELASERNIPLYLVPIPESPTSFGVEPSDASGVQIVKALSAKFEESDFSFPRHLTQSGASKLFEAIRTQIACFKPD